MRITQFDAYINIQFIKKDIVKFVNVEKEIICGIIWLSHPCSECVD